MLKRASHGFGWLALQAMMQQQAAAAFPHHKARAKHVILLFMDGGPSQVDTFDPKPLLRRDHGKPFNMKVEATQFDNIGTTFGSPFEFKQHGQSGLPMSSLFPHLAGCADDLCVIRSMKADFPEHSQACYFMHSGHPLQGRPSLGAWASYGLGTENANLPGFLVLHGGMIPLGGVENYSNAFLPATHQGSFLDLYSGGELVDNISPAESAATQRASLRLIQEADARFSSLLGAASPPVDAAIKNYETAFAMQSTVPEVADLRGETPQTKRLYGLDSANPFTAQYGRQCLLARRLVEAGVRFVEVSCVRGLRFVSPWDDHEDLASGHAKNAAAVDQPIAALLHDLKARGLLDETLVIFAGEFGRTPFAQGGKGRDHNPQGFSIWMAGGGIKGGTVYGSTDDYGYHAIENIVTVHDLHATVLHLLGLDHERLTYRWGGRDYRLTDVYGQVVEDILA